MGATGSGWVGGVWWLGRRMVYIMGWLGDNEEDWKRNRQKCEHSLQLAVLATGDMNEVRSDLVKYCLINTMSYCM